MYVITGNLNSESTGQDNLSSHSGDSCVEELDWKFDLVTVHLDCVVLADVDGLAVALDGDGLLRSVVVDEYSEVSIMEVSGQHVAALSAGEVVVTSVKGSDVLSGDDGLSCNYNQLTNYFFRIFSKCKIERYLGTYPFIVLIIKIFPLYLLMQCIVFMNNSQGKLTIKWWQDLSKSWFVHVEHLSHVPVVFGHMSDEDVESVLQVRLDGCKVDILHSSWDNHLKLDVAIVYIIGNPLKQKY